MKSKFLVLVAGLLAVGGLVGCGDQKVAAYVTNLTEESYQGRIEGLQESYMSGDPINISVIPKKYNNKNYFSIDKVTLNGQAMAFQRKEGDKYFYSGTAVGGENKIGAYFKLDKNINLVEDFKLNISDDIFTEVMKYDESTESKPGSIDTLDFRRDGIEQFRAPLLYNSDTKKYSGKADDPNFFFNCVDGDTTHMESFNLKYTVKIRYLMVDTQESTSQMEEWGLSGSYFSKYTFWGEFGKENQKDAHYEEKIKSLYSDTELQRLTGGATHIILLSQKMAAGSQYATLSEVQTGYGKNPTDVNNKGPYGSSTDGNGRDLALVWYAKSPNAKPSKDEFRCLNLELVYEGYSKNAATLKANGSYYYEYFDMAQLSAEANKRHMHSGEADPYYWYYDDTQNFKVNTMQLYRLYADGTTNNEIGFNPDSHYCDKMRLWKIEGYVSRKVGNAFYIQDKPSYTDAEIAIMKTGDRNRTFGYGIYAFTYANNSIEAGQHIRVIGALSSYGGSYQMQGLSFTSYTPNPNRDTVILDYTYNPETHRDEPTLYPIVPIQLTGEEFHTAQLPQVLVQITNNIYFNRFKDDQYDYLTDEEKALYDSDPEKYAYLRYTDILDGGRREVNPFTLKNYKMYNNSNAATLYGSYGDLDGDGNEIDKSEEYASTIFSGDAYRKGTKFMRVYVNQEVGFKYRGEENYSFKFYAGGELSYNTKGPQYIGETGTITVTFTRKFCNKNKNGGLIGISNGYISTTGKTNKMQISVVNAYDISGCLDFAVTE